MMGSSRYAFVVANCATGALRRFTVPVRPTVVVLAMLVVLPCGWVLHDRWDARDAIDSLRLQNARLEVENSAYRAAGAQLTRNVASLQAAIDDLSSRTGLNAAVDGTIERLPTAVAATALPIATVPTPGPTFDRLDDLLGTLDSELQEVRRGVAFREALAHATPTTWPADGWLSASYGYRTDPFTGERNFHSGVDISTRRGQPVYAAATGRVTSAERSGNYGNLIQIDHGFDLSTRYGHLSGFAVGPGATVERGDVIGYAGATGRATGHHVHYEVLVDGRTINPVRLLAERDSATAN